MPALRLRLRTVAIALLVPILGILVVAPLVVGVDVASRSRAERVALVDALRAELEAAPDRAAAQVAALARALDGPAGEGLLDPGLDGTDPGVVSRWTELRDLALTGTPAPARLRVVDPAAGMALRVGGGHDRPLRLAPEVLLPENRARFAANLGSGRPWRTLTTTGAVELGHPLAGSTRALIVDFTWEALAAVALGGVRPEGTFVLDGSGRRLLFRAPGQGPGPSGAAIDVLDAVGELPASGDRAIQHRDAVTLTWMEPGLWVGLVRPPDAAAMLLRAVPGMVTVGALLTVGAIGALVIHGRRRRRALADLAGTLGRLGSDPAAELPERIGDPDVDPVIDATHALARALERRRRDDARATRDELLGRIRARVVGEIATASGALDTLGRRLTDPTTPRGVFQGAGQVMLRLAERLERVDQSLPDGSDAPPEVELSTSPDASGAAADASHDLRTLLTEVAAAETPHASAPIEVRISVAPGLRADVTPPATLRAILRALVRNSVKAMPRGGTLKLEADGALDAVQVRVIDTGTGIDGAFMARSLFRPYESGWDDDPGLGLSLHHARRVLRALDGDVEVASHPGVGTRVTLSLPPRRPARNGSEPVATS